MSVSLNDKLSMSLDDLPDPTRTASRGGSTGGRAPRRNRGRNAGDRGRGGGSAMPGSVGSRVFVGNLDWSVSWQDLADFCSEVGAVKRADVLSEPSGRSKGCGIVEFVSAALAKRAIAELTDKELNGRKVFVREDREPSRAGAAAGVGRASRSRPSVAAGAGYSSKGKVWVGNLSFDTQWQDLKDHMRSAGNVARADIATRPDGRSKGWGVVEYETAAAARRAISTLEGSELDGREIQIKPDSGQNVPSEAGGVRASGASTKVYVGNLSFDTSWQDLKDHMRQAGNVAHADVITRPDGRSKGFGIVEFETAAAARKACENLNGSELDERDIIVRPDNRTSGNSGAPPPSGDSKSRIYVGNIPYSLTWQTLKDHLKDEGFDVVRTDIPTIPGTTKMRGFALVELSSPNEAQRAIDHLNDIQMDDRQLYCHFDTK